MNITIAIHDENGEVITTGEALNFESAQIELGRLERYMEKLDANADFLKEDLQDADDHITEMAKEEEAGIMGIIN